MIRGWEADPSSPLVRRLGKSPTELGTTGGEQGCPDIWELENGDIAVVGRDLTDSYLSSLPRGLLSLRMNGSSSSPAGQPLRRRQTFLMLSPQADGPGQRLGLDDYSEDFGRHFWRSGSEGFWKLERQQSFQEPGWRAGRPSARGTGTSPWH